MFRFVDFKQGFGFGITILASDDAPSTVELRLFLSIGLADLVGR
jgi:hypothetical protein